LEEFKYVIINQAYMIICISGTPGTGKTTLAKKLAERIKAKYIDGNSIVRKYSISEGYDKEKDCKIIDPRKFSKASQEECKDKTKTYILDSHLSHNLPKSKVNLCIICKYNLKKLEKRLKTRNYSKEKIRENLDAEIFEICLTEAQKKGHEIIVYNKNLKEIMSKIKSLEN